MADPTKTPALSAGQVWSPRRQWASGPIPDRTILNVEAGRIEWKNCLFQASWSEGGFRTWIRNTRAQMSGAKP